MTERNPRHGSAQGSLTRRRWRLIVLPGIVAGLLVLVAQPAAAMSSTAAAPLSPLLFALIVFVVCTAIGIIAIMSGTGGGVLFTTLFLGFTSIHPDIVRATGLLAAVCGTRIGARRYLRKGVANIRLVLLMGSCYSGFAVLGALFGLTLTRRFGETGVAVIKLALGIIVVAVGGMYLLVKGTAYPEIDWVDRFTRRLGLGMAYWEESLRQRVDYQVTRSAVGLVVVCAVGFVAGTLGLGAGWAITPLLNFVMLVPLKVSAATSTVVISLGDTAAIFPYLMSNSIFPVFAVPTIVGLILGAEIGSRLAVRVKAGVIRYVLIAIMLGAGLKLVVTGVALL